MRFGLGATCTQACIDVLGKVLLCCVRHMNRALNLEYSLVRSTAEVLWAGQRMDGHLCTSRRMVAGEHRALTLRPLVL